jgi:protein SCO1/2
MRGGLASLAVLAAAGSMAGCGASNRTAPAAATTTPGNSQLRGLVPTPLPRTPDFTLTDTSGRPFNFPARTRGKLAYLYFGYTHCPDVCPTTIGDLAAALRLVKPSVRRRVEVVFVTVDPSRDTARVLRAWLDHYNHSFVGLRGSEREILAAGRASGVPLVAPPRHHPASYGVDHSTFVLPYSRDGRAHVVYTQGFKAADYAHDMKLLAT